MNVQVKAILSQKAAAVAAYLIALQVPCNYTLIDHGINFRLKHEGKIVVLTLSYKPTKNTWKAYSQDSWVKDTLLPRLLDVIDSDTPTASHVASVAASVPPVTDASAYFVEALESFRLLQPFEQEYIDFSIIGEYAREGVRRVLNDRHSQNLDRASLQETLEFPLSSDFSTTKEYLFRCLTLCRIPTSL